MIVEYQILAIAVRIEDRERGLCIMVAPGAIGTNETSLVSVVSEVSWNSGQDAIWVDNQRAEDVRTRMSAHKSSNGIGRRGGSIDRRGGTQL
mgnify:CR=1 FL=1